MQAITAPETVPFSKVRAFLSDLGIDGVQAQFLTRFECGIDGVHVEMYALNEEGHPYFPTPGSKDVAMHSISMRLDLDA